MTTAKAFDEWFMNAPAGGEYVYARTLSWLFGTRNKPRKRQTGDNRAQEMWDQGYVELVQRIVEKGKLSDMYVREYVAIKRSVKASRMSMYYDQLSKHKPATASQA